jgi:hypothetical protein
VSTPLIGSAFRGGTRQTAGFGADESNGYESGANANGQSASMSNQLHDVHSLNVRG